MVWAVVLMTFVMIVPVELPDKTFIATLVLATRLRPLYVWLGVGAAFLVQTTIAVTVGGLLAELPKKPVSLVAAAVFLAGAVLLWRSASKAKEHADEAEESFAGKIHDEKAGPLRSIALSFTVLFLAEWGDLSQLLTAGLAARTGEPLSVFAGAWTALLLVSGMGALLGRALLAKLSLATVQRVGAVICLLVALLTLLELAGVELPVG